MDIALFRKIRIWPNIFKKEKTEEWFGLVWLNMVFNTNFNNIFDISWRSVLFIGGENRKLVTGTDCIGSCKFNYHMNTTPSPLK